MNSTIELKLKIAAIAAVAALIFPLNATAQEAPPSFDGLYAALRTAMRTKDKAALEGLFAPDFQSEDVDGQLASRAQVLESLMKSSSSPPSESRTTVVSGEVDGTSAEIVQRYEASARRQGADGVSHLLEVNALSRDTWKQLDGNWRITKTVTQEMNLKVDGSPTVHKTHASK